MVRMIGDKKKKQTQKLIMSRSKAKPRRTPDPPVSYLDGVPMKLSDAFRRPPRVALPFNVVVNDLDNVLRELYYDFSLEESVVRNAEEQRRVWEEAEKKRKDQEEAAAAKKAKEEADVTAAASAAASADAAPKPASAVATSASTNANNNAVAATRPSAIRTSRPEVPTRPHPSSLPSPLLREVTAEKILQPKTLESARNFRPTASAISTSFSNASTSTVVATTAPPSSSTAPSSAAAGGVPGAGASAFNVADWERCEDPFEIIERKTINDMEELESILEIASSSRMDPVAETPAEAATETNAAAVAAEEAVSAQCQSAENLKTGDAAESSSAEAEVLSNLERPPSYDEVVGGNAGAIADEPAAAAPSETIAMSLHNLKVTPAVSSPASKRRGEMSSPSTPTSSGTRSTPNSQTGSPVVDAAATSPKAFFRRESSSPMETSAGIPSSSATIAAPKPTTFYGPATPTTPTASYPEYVSLPDFPSLSEADLPSNQNEAARDDSDPSASEPPARDVFSEDESSQAQAVSQTPSAGHNSYDGLSAPLKVLVDKLVDMGFDMGVTSRAAEHFGVDEKQVIDHLCAVSLLSEEGYAIVDVEEALFFMEGKEKLAKKFLMALTQLRQFGFEDSKIKAALVASGNDTEKALDQLMVT